MAFKLKDAELIRFQVFCWKAAVDNRLKSVTPNIMALTLLKSGPNNVTKVLEAMIIDIGSLTSALEKHLKASYPKRRPKFVEHEMISFSENGNDIMSIANDVRDFMADPATSVHHVLMAILKNDKALSDIFEQYGVTLPKFRIITQKVLSVESAKSNLNDSSKELKGLTKPTDSKPIISKANEKEVITKYCKNLTDLANQNKLDPVIGREKEIDRLVVTLGRRKKNNAILVGEPGVGKTAIVEGLAKRINSGSVPSFVKDVQVFQLNLSSVVSKTTCRGQFEERMKLILDTFAVNKNYILFIDEMHTLVGAGAAIGGLDAANIMKPALSNGEVRCIGATTEDEYRKYFKKDGAMDRRFQRIFVDEPSKADTIAILTGIKPIIETHHNCIIPNEIIKNAVELSIRYVTDRRLPDKAIDCIDEACANAVVRVNDSTKKIIVLKSDIVRAIALQTDIPVEVVGVSDLNRVKNISEILKNKIVGQDVAINEISSVLLNSYSGIRNPNRPIGCFVFGGPSGSGTTYMAELMAECLFDSDSSFIRLDMSEFSEKFGNTKLIGSPPGYVGYGEKNQLTDKVARKQHCLILLDGIENANEDVLKVFTQAMSKGFVTDASGNEVSFRNSIIVMTMNFDPLTNNSHLGFENNSNEQEQDDKKKEMTDTCRKMFGDDFVNRIDEFIAFSSLQEQDLKMAVEMRLDTLTDRLKNLGVDLNYDEKIIDVIVSNVMNEERPNIKSIDRFVRRFVEHAIAIELSESKGDVSCLRLGAYNMNIICSACVTNELT